MFYWLWLWLPLQDVILVLQIRNFSYGPVLLEVVDVLTLYSDQQEQKVPESFYY